MKNRFLTPLHWIILLACALHAPLVKACDFCSVYNSIQSSRGSAGEVNLGLAHQFTHYESNIHQVGEEFLPGQHLESNILQFFVDYSISDKLSLQFNIPLIDRSFRRIRSGEVENGSETGLGDIALLLEYEVYREQGPNGTLLWEVLGGIKAPTGNSDRLQEEQLEIDNHGFRHGVSSSSLVGGDDLALGSGSWDWIIGTSILIQRQRYFFSSNLHYSLRREGDFGYEYGDDLQWSAGPAYYLLLEHDQTLAARLKISGEYKSRDSIMGEEISGSRDKRLFVGPEMLYSLGQDWFIDLGVDFSVTTEQANKGVAPHYRMLLAVSHKFSLG